MRGRRCCGRDRDECSGTNPRLGSRPGAAALLSAAREKIETGRAGDRSQLQVPDEHRADVGRMLGVSWELSDKAVTLKSLRTALERAGTTLEAVLVELGGPMRNAATEKAQAQAAEAAHRARVLSTLTDAGISRSAGGDGVAVGRWS